MGSKGNQVTTNQTQTYTPNPAISGAGSEAIRMAKSAVNAPFQQPVAPVAQFSPFQQLGFGETLATQGMAQPYFNLGQGYLQESAAPVTGADVANYYNPMAANVTAQMQNIFGRQMSQATGQATQAAGGVGADRIGVAQANLANQQGLAAGQTYAGLYQQALQAAEQQKQMAAGAGFGIAQMGPAAQGAQLQGIQALMGAGGMQQQLSQAQLNALYQNQLARIAYPFQTAQYLAGITGGLAPAMGGTTTGQATTTYPTPSLLAQGLGLGTAGIGMFGAMGNANMFPSVFGPGGWNYQNRGGRVMADGGGLDDIQPPMGAQAPGAMSIKGSPVPMISLQPGAGKSGPGGQWMTIHDLPMQPPGMPQNKQGMAGTAGDIAAATKLLEAIPEGMQFGGSALSPQLSQDMANLRQRVPWPLQGMMPFGGGQKGSGGLFGGFGGMMPWQHGQGQRPQMPSWLSNLPQRFQTPHMIAQGGAVDPLYAGQGYQSGGELGEVFPNTLAQDANPVSTGESYADLFKPDVVPPSPPMGGGPMAGTGNLPQPDLSPPVEPIADVPLPRARPAMTAPDTSTFTERFPAAPMGAGVLAGNPALADKIAPHVGRQGSDAFNQILDRAGAVTKEQESGGRYDNVTTTRNTRGRPQSALGAYGIMDFNLPQWSKQAFGRVVTPQEFLAKPELQDALYRYKMGDYIRRFGIEGAGRAWLGGEGAVNAPMARDPFGTVALDYGKTFASKVMRPGDASAMVAGPGVPSGGATPASLEPVPPQGPMGASDFREPYPDALQRDWGQRATRSPWMSLVKAGAQMATTVGPIGSVIGQGVKAGAGELEEQRKALTSEEAINLKAKALHDTANYHLDVIAGRKENRLVRLQALSGLHPADIVRIQQKVRSDPVWSLRPDEEQHAEVERQVIEAAKLLRDQQQQPGGTPATTPAGSTPATAEADPGEGKRIVGHYYKTPEGTRQWTG